MDYKSKLIRFVNSINFGIKIANDFYGGVNEAYLIDYERFSHFKNDAVNTLQELGKIEKEELENACKNAFCGRLEMKGDDFVYTAGQFWNIEVPQAVLAVAEYIKNNR